MDYEAIIIGTGQAAPALAGRLAENNIKTAVVEESHYGGSCVNVGCTPTKSYVASARRAYVAKNSGEHGVYIDGSVKINLKTIKNRKDKIVHASRNGLKKFLENTENLTVYHGKGRFTGPKTIKVNGKELKADKIFINVGARPRIPDGFDQIDFLTNKTILELEELPEHLVVVGGGYVGLEFAQMFRRFGSRITLIEKGGQLLKKEDKDVGEAVREVLENEGIEVRLHAECIESKEQDGKITVTLNCKNGAPSVKGTHLLIATGRVPNTDDLGLDKAGIETDEQNYIKVNDSLETNIRGVFALGDCNGEGAFTHTAYNDFQIVTSRLFGNGDRRLSDRFPCYAVFIDPALARVGMNEKEVREKNLNANIAYRPLSKIARAKEMGETEGFLKIIIEAETEKVLGAVFLGAGADEYIHSITDLMYANAPYTVIRDAVHIHPTISELIPTMLEHIKPLESQPFSEPPP